MYGKQVEGGLIRTLSYPYCLQIITNTNLDVVKHNNGAIAESITYPYPLSSHATVGGLGGDVPVHDVGSVEVALAPATTNHPLIFRYRNLPNKGIIRK